jgi:hypothetical protein
MGNIPSIGGENIRTVGRVARGGGTALVDLYFIDKCTSKSFIGFGRDLSSNAIQCHSFVPELLMISLRITSRV